MRRLMAAFLALGILSSPALLHAQAGSTRDIAGVADPTGRIVGLMPHPEHAVEELTGPTTDGLRFFTSILASLVGAGAGAAT